MHPALSVVRAHTARRWFATTNAVLSGHNKWSKIKQKKGVNDLRKSTVYAKAGRDIVVAARSGSSDPAVNTALAHALKRAKAAGLPKDNIEKALARAVGGSGKDASAHIVYEAMVSGSVGIIIECVTDNANRTIHKIREILNGYNGRFAPVRFLFDRVGRVQVQVPKDDRETRIEELFEAAVEGGAEDFVVEDESDIVEFTCPPDALEGVTKAVSLSKHCEELVSSEWVYRARDPPPDDLGEDIYSNISELVDDLEENEDCVRVWTTL